MRPRTPHLRPFRRATPGRPMSDPSANIFSGRRRAVALRASRPRRRAIPVRRRARADTRSRGRGARETMEPEVDYLIIGSGFGGSVCGLRLVEKGYRVVMLEKGRRFRPEDFPKSNWDLRRWLWMPRLGFHGLFKMTFLRHLTVLSGVGVGGGSLVYANTLPTPKDEFFAAAGWGALADWRRELAPHYRTALRMLGATQNPNLGPVDEVLRDVGKEIGREDGFEPVRVAVYFGTPGETAPDP